MIACLLVITFFAVVGTGPDGVDWLARRRALRDRPVAKVLYLPDGACRERPGDATGPVADCWHSNDS